METKQKVLAIVNEKIKREGVDKLVKFLEESDYFTAPASTKFHSCEVGGLANHSLSVYECLVKKVKAYELDYSDETIAICGLFHDLCKVNFYKEKPFEAATAPQLKYLYSLSGVNFPAETTSKDAASRLIEQYKNSTSTKVAEPEGPVWIVDDQLPIGHGEKSLFILQKYIDVTDDEALAIRWHMSAFDPGTHFNYPSGFAFRQASTNCKLVTALATADFESDKLLGI